MVDAPDLATRINAHLDALGRLHDGAEMAFDTDLNYTPREPVRVRIRRRKRRYDIDDDGAAVRLAGKPSGWLEPVEQLVALEGLNVNRRGVVFACCGGTRPGGAGGEDRPLLALGVPHPARDDRRVRDAAPATSNSPAASSNSSVRT